MSTVTVRTIENILTKKGRKTWLEASGHPVLSYCPRDFAAPDGLGIIHNGESISRDVAENAHMRDGDEVIFYRKPRDPATLLVGLVISIVIAAVSYQLQANAAPTARGQKKDLEDSETYGFSGIVNTVTPGTRIPIIYGAHRVGGQIVQQYLSKNVQRDPTSIQIVKPSGASINSLIGVSSGEIDNISDLRVNRNRNQAGIFRFTRGTNHQTALSGFTDVRTQVPKDVSVTGIGGSYTTTTDQEVDAFEVLFRFTGLFRTSDRGQFLQKEVQIRVEYKEVGTPNYVIDLVSISAAQRNQFDIAYRSPDLPRAKYDIRITRLTPDDTDATGLSDFNVYAIVEIIDDAQAYPGVALYSVTQGPTALVSGGIPTYDVLVRGKKVRVYQDVNTFAVTWNNNPAYCLLDFLTDKKYGLGAYIDYDRVDLQSFIDAADFCIAENLTLNIVLDGSLNAFDAIRQMCMAGRLLFLLRGDKWTVRPDRAEEPVQFFSMGRIMKGSFTASKQSKADKANYLIGEFLNAALDYERDSLPKEDPTLEVGSEQIETTVNLTGVTSADQANKLLNYMMLANRLQTRNVEFEVGVEALAMEAGDVFAISHDVPAWGLSGQIRSVDETGTTLRLDRTLTLEVGKEYELTVYHDKHEKYDVVRVTNNPETTDLISVSGDWTEVPKKGYDYSFGELTKSFVKYRCISISRGRAVGTRRVRAVEYNEAVYGTDLLVMPTPSVSQLPDPLRVPPDVTELRLSERTVYAEDGTLSTAIDVFFNLPLVAGVRAEVFWREAGLLAWEPVTATLSGYATITQNVRSPGVTYEVAVAATSVFGVRKEPEDSPWTSITTVGVTRQPDNVSDFRVDRTMEGLVFSWTAVDPARNFDLANYEIRAGNAWDTALTIGEPSETRFTTTAFVKGENTYLIKAKNTAGKFSAQPRSVVIEVDARLNENVVFSLEEDPAFDGTKEGFEVIDDKLRLNTTDQVVAWRNDNSTTSLGGSQYIPGGRKAGFRVAGTYTTDPVQITSGNAETAIVSYDLVQEQLDASIFWSASDVSGQTWNSEFAKRAWSVAPDGKVQVRVEMRFSTTTNAESAFGPWQERAQNISVQVKWAQARLHVEIVDPAYTVEVSRFRIYFDVPDRRDAGSETTSAVGDVTVSFGRPFNNPPKVACTIQTASAGDDLVRGAPTTTGFALSVFNGGSRVVRTVEYIAVGF